MVVDGFHWKDGYGASSFIEFRNGYDYAGHSTVQNYIIDVLRVDQSELDQYLSHE